MSQKVCPLSYPLRLPNEMQAPATAVLEFSRPYMQQVVDALWPKLEQIGQLEGKHIWKPLEKWLPRPVELTSRLWRDILEGAGRTLRAQADRKRLFDLLLPLLKDEHFSNGDDKLLKLAYSLRDEIDGNQEKIGYLFNLIEQIADFYANNERLPVFDKRKQHHFIIEKSTTWLV